MLEHVAQKEDRGREATMLDDLTVRELAKTDLKMFFYGYGPCLPPSRWRACYRPASGFLCPVERMLWRGCATTPEQGAGKLWNH